MEKTSSSSSSGGALFIDLNSKPMHNPSENIPPPLDLIQELHRVRLENKKLNDMLAIIQRGYADLINDIQRQQAENNKKMRFMHSCRPKEFRSNVSRVHVRIDPSDPGLVVKDGHKWRKYGQKVTRDNTSPRAYYKCSMAQTNCPAKKKVQRSVDDPSLLVATYEGQHNHSPSQPNVSVALPTLVDPDLTDPALFDKVQSAMASSTAIQQFFIGKMASSLMENRTFTASLAAAISGKILDDVLEDNNDGDCASKSRVYSM